MGENASLLSPSSEFKIGYNTQIYITPPPSNHNTVHSIKEISIPPSITNSKDDNSDIERNRKTSSFAAGKFWFLKPGNLLTGASGGAYNPYHTIAATPSNTFNTSPSTVRINQGATNVETGRKPKKRKKTVITAPLIPSNAQEPQRKSRIRTTSLCDPTHNELQCDSNSKQIVKRDCESKELDVDLFKSSPKIKKTPEMPSNFETSEAVLRLQELFSATHSIQCTTNSNNSSIASGEVPAGVAYAESCINAFGFANSANSRSNSRHQSPLALASNESKKMLSKHSSQSTLVQSNSTPMLSEMKKTMQEQYPSPSHSPIADSPLLNQTPMKRIGLDKIIYRKQSSPSPQRHEALRLGTVIESHMTKSKSTSNFFQSQNINPSPSKERLSSSKEVVTETILEDDHNDTNDNLKGKKKILPRLPKGGIAHENKKEKLIDDFKMIAVPSKHVRERKNMLYTVLEADSTSSEVKCDFTTMLDAKNSNLFEQIKGLYGNWLFNSQLYIRHCEVLNKLDPYYDSYEHDTKESYDTKRSEDDVGDQIFGKNVNTYTKRLQIECSYLGSINTSCGFCGECYNLESQCTGCRKPSIYCSICRVPVFGLASTCSHCNHGGHTIHIQEWFHDW